VKILLLVAERTISTIYSSLSLGLLVANSMSGAEREDFLTLVAVRIDLLETAFQFARNARAWAWVGYSHWSKLFS